MKIATHSFAEIHCKNSLKYFRHLVKQMYFGSGKSRYTHRLLFFDVNIYTWKKCSALSSMHTFLVWLIQLYFIMHCLTQEKVIFFSRLSLLLLLCEYLRLPECGWKLILDYVLFTSEQQQKKINSILLLWTIDRERERERERVHTIPFRFSYLCVSTFVCLLCPKNCNKSLVFPEKSIFFSGLFFARN